MNASDSAFVFHVPGKIFSWKNIFYILAISGFIVLPLQSRNAGISGDEEVHYLHSQKVLTYYQSFGTDTSAISTPQTHLKYYGQSFDNFTTLLINLFHIEDIYSFRHICNSIVGWLAILFSGILAIYLSGYRAGTLTLLILYLSPRFVGHAFNNLKDIPFAFAYILGLYFIFRLIEGLPKPRFRNILFLILAIGLAISVRIGGVLLILFLLVFTGLFILSYWLKENSLVTINILSRSFLVVLLVSVGGYLMGLVFWPYALENPLKNPMTALQIMASFPTTLRQIFEGEYIWSDHLPWYYLLKYMLITIPSLVWVGFILFLFFLKGIVQSRRWIFILFLLVAFAFPIFFVIYKGSNLYGAWRHFLFVFPCLVVLSALGFDHLLKHFSSKLAFILTASLFLVMAFYPIRFMIRNHPYQYMYFNEWTGGIRGAYGEYETDYYFHSMCEASEWLTAYLDESGKPGTDKVKVAANFPVSWYFRNDPDISRVEYVKYYERGNSDWDYAIIGNSYIHPFQLTNNIWPPDNTIKTIRVDDVPVCAVLERRSGSDYRGYKLLKEGYYSKSLEALREAIVEDPANESAIINMAKVYLIRGATDSAKLVLSRFTEIYPDYDVAIGLLAEAYHQENRVDLAKSTLMKNIEINLKYFPSYIKLAELFFEEGNDEMGLYYLRKCLSMNPGFIPALTHMGRYYEKQGDPEKAKKFFDRIRSN